MWLLVPFIRPAEIPFAANIAEPSVAIEVTGAAAGAEKMKSLRETLAVLKSTIAKSGIPAIEVAEHHGHWTRVGAGTGNAARH